MLLQLAPFEGRTRHFITDTNLFRVGPIPSPGIEKLHNTKRVHSIVLVLWMYMYFDYVFPATALWGQHRAIDNRNRYIWGRLYPRYYSRYRQIRCKMMQIIYANWCKFHSSSSLDGSTFRIQTWLLGPLFYSCSLSFWSFFHFFVYLIFFLEFLYIFLKYLYLFFFPSAACIIRLELFQTNLNR